MQANCLCIIFNLGQQHKIIKTRKIATKMFFKKKFSEINDSIYFGASIQFAASENHHQAAKF